MHVILSAVATYACWFLLVILFFLAAALLVAWCVVRFIPPHQERIPRHLALLACLVSSVMASTPAAMQVGTSGALLALGDAMVGSRFVVILPLQEGGLGSSVDRLRTQVREEIRQARNHGIVGYSIRYIALGPLTEGYESIRALRDGMGKHAAANSRTLILAWENARTALSTIVLRKVAGSVLFAALYWSGMLLAGGLLLIISRPELTRVSRLMRPNRS